MRTARQLCLSLSLLTLALPAIVSAQGQPSAYIQSRAPQVTATAAVEQVRFAALGAVMQVRLEVFAASGEKLFDSDFKFGTMLDWPVQDQQGQRLGNGAYRCVVTVKDFAGRLSQRLGAISVQVGEVALRQPEYDPLAIREASPLNAAPRPDFLTLIREGATPATTVLAHDGSNGRLVTGSGALSFRTGDFFAGKDVERMRLTPEGNLGLGVENPTAKLDVGGLIRTSEGVVFPDGTIQTTAANVPGSSQTAGKSDGSGGSQENIRSGPLSVDGSGTSGKIAKWASSAALGDSIITESGGTVSVSSSAAPAATLTAINTSASGEGYGLLGETRSTADAAFGVIGLVNATPSGYGSAGVIGINRGATSYGYGVSGQHDGSGIGVFGFSLYGTAVHGEGNSLGVRGECWSASCTGVKGESASGKGVYGASSSGDGVRGENTSSSSAAGVYGVSSAYNGNGVIGSASNGASAYGVLGSSSGGYGVVGSSSSGVAVWGLNSSGVAGKFNGNVQVFGTLSKSAGSFKIDHPLDPENKYLSHSFVESPEMMNVYNGNVTTDADGVAVVALPDYFETLNRDFRYQLTVIGQFAQAIVANKIQNNRFTIRTDKSEVEVSWQVTGIRQDAYANARRIPVVEEKPEAERGHYLHPELYGQPEEKGIEWAQRPELMRKMKEQRDRNAPEKLTPPKQ